MTPPAKHDAPSMSAGDPPGIEAAVAALREEVRELRAAVEQAGNGARGISEHVRLVENLLAGVFRTFRRTPREVRRSVEWLDTFIEGIARAAPDEPGGASYDDAAREEGRYWGEFSDILLRRFGPTWLHDPERFRHTDFRAVHRLFGDWRLVEIFWPEIRLLLDHADTLGKGRRMLCIGCGSGWINLVYARRGVHAAGIEISPRLIEIAEEFRAREPEDVRALLEYGTGDLNFMELPADTYDCVVSLGTLHHIRNIDFCVHQIARTLKPGGELRIVDQVADDASNPAITRFIRTFLRNRTDTSTLWDHLGPSPFEGTTGTAMLPVIARELEIVEKRSLDAFAQCFVQNVDLPERLRLPICRIVARIERLLIRLRLARGGYVYLVARKR